MSDLAEVIEHWEKEKEMSKSMTPYRSQDVYIDKLIKENEALKISLKRKKIRIHGQEKIQVGIQVGASTAVYTLLCGIFSIESHISAWHPYLIVFLLATNLTIWFISQWPL